MLESMVFFGMSHSTNADTHTRMSTHTYEYAHPIPMSSSEILGRLDLQVYEVSQRASRYRRGCHLPLKE
jgi:hypothetical protein